VRGRVAVAICLALVAGGCAQGPIDLPDDPLTRATACTGVRALELREGMSGDGRVSFAGFTEILHFAMLSSLGDGTEVNLRRLISVSHRAPIMMEELRGKNWRSLVEPCNAAFPETQRPAPPLPGEAFEAGMTCFGLADFLARTSPDYPNEQRRLTALADRALAAAAPVLRQRAGDEQEASRISAGYTARSFKAGTPASLIEQCMRRFPAPGPAG
jgi:hypothetical protein